MTSIALFGLVTALFSPPAFDASTKAVRKCSQQFEQVKAQRFHLFSQCFEHVSVVIDQIYKRICRNDSAQVKQQNLNCIKHSFLMSYLLLISVLLPSHEKYCQS